MIRRILLVFACVASLKSGLARADATSEARQHFDRALSLVDDAQMAEALIEFQRCYEIKPQYQVLYNIGQAYIALARPVEAHDFLERYLKEGGAAVPKNRRADVEKELVRQQARIAMVDLNVQPPGATVRVDNRTLGTAPLSEPVRVGVGTHVVAASLDGYAAAETNVTVAGEDRRVVELSLEKIASVAEVPPPAAPPVAAPIVAPMVPPPLAAVAVSPPDPARAGSAQLQTVGYVGVGAGVISMAVGGGLWLRARSQHNQALEHCPANDCDEQAKALQSKAKDNVVWANVLGFGGGTLLVAGAALIYFGRGTQVVPTAAPGFAGLCAQGVF